MIPNPILKVLSTMSCHTVRHLLIGGQACVLYGAAEFSRDCDLVILASEGNFSNFRQALAELRAESIAVPQFQPEYLGRGHAVHFRCRHPDVNGLRIDVMTRLRGCLPFEQLWERRTTVEDSGTGVTYEVLGIEDLVQAKKTQIDKDWPIIRRLLEAHYFAHGEEPTGARISFWLRECRTPALLIELRRRFPREFAEATSTRPGLSTLGEFDADAIERLFRQEADEERRLDEEYWRPLKQELEHLRRTRERPE